MHRATLLIFPVLAFVAACRDDGPLTTHATTRDVSAQVTRTQRVGPGATSLHVVDNCRENMTRTPLGGDTRSGGGEARGLSGSPPHLGIVQVRANGGDAVTIGMIPLGSGGGGLVPPLPGCPIGGYTSLGETFAIWPTAEPDTGDTALPVPEGVSEPLWFALGPRVQRWIDARARQMQAQCACSTTAQQFSGWLANALGTKLVENKGRNVLSLIGVTANPSANTIASGFLTACNVARTAIALGYDTPDWRDWIAEGGHRWARDNGVYWAHQVPFQKNWHLGTGWGFDLTGTTCLARMGQLYFGGQLDIHPSTADPNVPFDGFVPPPTWAPPSPRPPGGGNEY